MNPAAHFTSTYLPQVCDFLADRLSDADIIIPMENKGARLFEEAASLLPVKLKGRVFLTNAIPYLQGSDLKNKNVALVDDSVLYGRKLKQVSANLAGKEAHLQCFAFAASADSEDVKKRQRCGLRIDSALNLDKHRGRSA